MSVLSRDGYKRVRRRVDKSIVGVRAVKTATGDKMRIYGKMLVDFKVLGKIFVASTLIADITDDGILGMDWLRKFGVCPDPEKGIAHIKVPYKVSY